MHDVNEVAAQFTDAILKISKEHIEYRQAGFAADSHPWINDRVKKAMDEDCRAYGTNTWEQSVSKCRMVLAEEYASYRRRLKDKLAALTKNSKVWWRYNRELLDHVRKPLLYLHCGKTKTGSPSQRKRRTYSQKPFKEFAAG